MKPTTLAIIIATIPTLAPLVHAEGLVFDSFSEGGFDLVTRLRETDTDLIVSPLVNRRFVDAYDSYDFRAFLDSSVGIMRYEVDREPPYSASNYLKLSYRNTDGSSFSLAPYAGFLLEITEVEGAGSLYMTINGDYFGISQPEPITQAGPLLYPFSNTIFGSFSNPITSVQFYFLANSEDFTVAVDQISVVPEPTGAVLSALGFGILGALRRRRD